MLITNNLLESINQNDIQRVFSWSDLENDKYALLNVMPYKKKPLPKVKLLDRISFTQHQNSKDFISFIFYGLNTEKLLNLSIKQLDDDIFNYFSENFKTTLNMHDEVFILEIKNNQPPRYDTINLSTLFPNDVAFQCYLNSCYTDIIKARIIHKQNNKYNLLKSASHEKLISKCWKNLDEDVYLFLDVYTYPRITDYKFISTPIDDIKEEWKGILSFDDAKIYFDEYYIVLGVKQNILFKFYVIPNCPLTSILRQHEIVFKQNYHINENILQIKIESNEGIYMVTTLSKYFTYPNTTISCKNEKKGHVEYSYYDHNNKKKMYDLNAALKNELIT